VALEQALDAAVLAVGAVQRDPGGVDLFAAQVRAEIVGAALPVDGDRVVALALERRVDAAARVERHVALRRRAAHDDADPLALELAHASSPTTLTSSSRRMPNRCTTAARTISTSARKSFAVAPSALTSQLACTGETSAPPTRRPFKPHASI